MAGKGGYQAPSKPAMSSGPGAMSQRTDGGPASKQAARYMAGGDYGDGTDMMNIQQSAPMAATPDVKGMPAGQVARAAQQAQVVPMNAPTQRPDEPIRSWHGVTWTWRTRCCSKRCFQSIYCYVHASAFIHCKPPKYISRDTAGHSPVKE